MNVVYFIGNGLDKAQGMKTSYPEFYDYLAKQKGSSLLELMKSKINTDKKLWSDMEFAFGQFTTDVRSADLMENFYFELNNLLQIYLKGEDETFVPSDKNKSKFVQDFMSPTKYFGETDRQRYTSFANKVGPNKDISVITLNYTNTLEKLFSLGNSTDKSFDNSNYLRQIIHVHGRLDDSIIVGLDNEDQIVNEQFRNNEDIRDFIIKVQSNRTMKFLRSDRCDKLLSEANLILLYGVSLGETDKRWWQIIGEQFRKRDNLAIIQHVFRPNAYLPTQRQRLGKIERGYSKCLLERLGIEPEEQTDEMRNRLFFIINTSMFVNA